MRHINLNDRWKEFLVYIYQAQHQRSEARRKQIVGEREQNIEILQRRYGYSKEKAESELDTHYSNTILGKIS